MLLRHPRRAGRVQREHASIRSLCLHRVPRERCFTYGTGTARHSACPSGRRDGGGAVSNAGRRHSRRSRRVDQLLAVLTAVRANLACRAAAPPGQRRVLRPAPAGVHAGAGMPCSADRGAAAPPRQITRRSWFQRCRAAAPTVPAAAVSFARAACSSLFSRCSRSTALDILIARRRIFRHAAVRHAHRTLPYLDPASPSHTGTPNIYEEDCIPDIRIVKS